MKFCTNGMGRNMEKTSYKCDLDCPVKPKGDFIPVCCQNCEKSKKDFVTDENRHLWTKGRGFHSPKGCRLPREEMPQECKTYDCRRYVFTMMRIWAKGKWEDCFVSESGFQK
jgi:hypothetical protein